MPIAKTKAKAASQARIAQVALAVKRGSTTLARVEPAGFRRAVRSMMSASESQLTTIKRDARSKAGSVF